MKFGLSDSQRWPVIIISVLVAQIAFGIWMARVAGNDPNFAVEPDYYAKAVNWDETMAQSRRDRALGWQAVATMTRAEGRTATLQVSLVDSLGAAVQADSVQVEALEVAHARFVDKLTLIPSGSGYAAPVANAGVGLWEVRVRAMRGTDLYTAKLRTELK